MEVIFYEQREWKLPASTADCLETLALLKFGGVEAKYTVVGSSSVSDNGNLPVLSVTSDVGGTDIVCGIHRVRQRLREKVMSEHLFGNAWTNHQQRSTMGLVEETLHWSIEYEWYLQEPNWEYLQKTLFQEEFSSWPARSYLAEKRRDKVKAFFATTRPRERQEAEEEADFVFKALSEILMYSDGRYYGGHYPNYVDACAFAHLAMVLFVPLPQPNLRRRLVHYPVLVEYVQQILKTYWRLDIVVPEIPLSTEEDNQPDGESDEKSHATKYVVTGMVVVFTLFLLNSNIPKRLANWYK
mmetsp:Transcript_16473/g.46456  ORF Transcript_16473/g.46456 Transcript_16473/m.46456 type:complete len:298 (+) Transcript_16473:57-950(+)